MFFRKKRYSEVEGYDRISRMIDDQPADGDEVDEDLLEEDTVLLTRDSQESQMSSEDATVGRETMPPTVESAVEESVTVVKAPVPKRRRRLHRSLFRRRYQPRSLHPSNRLE
jgi:hypothetical protein